MLAIFKQEDERNARWEAIQQLCKSSDTSQLKSLNVLLEQAGELEYDVLVHHMRTRECLIVAMNHENENAIRLILRVIDFNDDAIRAIYKCKSVAGGLMLLKVASETMPLSELHQALNNDHKSETQTKECCIAMFDYFVKEYKTMQSSLYWLYHLLFDHKQYTKIGESIKRFKDQVGLRSIQSQSSRLKEPSVYRYFDSIRQELGLDRVVERWHRSINPTIFVYSLCAWENRDFDHDDFFEPIASWILSPSNMKTSNTFDFPPAKLFLFELAIAVHLEHRHCLSCNARRFIDTLFGKDSIPWIEEFGRHFRQFLVTLDRVMPIKDLSRLILSYM